MSNEHVHPAFHGALAFAKPAKRHQLPKGECAYCDSEREQGNTFHPSHDASERCESGKRNHCSCDRCF